MRKLLLDSSFSEVSRIDFSTKKITITLSHAWNKLGIGGPALPGYNPDRPGQDNPHIPDLGDQCAQVELLAVDECKTGVLELTDEEIIDMCRKNQPQTMKTGDEECAAAVVEISHTQAVKCFSTCLQWFEQ